AAAHLRCDQSKGAKGTTRAAPSPRPVAQPVRSMRVFAATAAARARGESDFCSTVERELVKYPNGG
ncbi:MAG TPA: hypothetical protein VMU14_06245, partial [Acidimicrobiales bacterium]|nr:hypothetical protein [Acidimicrobiales bacterium]